jgi:hypothetical protein
MWDSIPVPEIEEEELDEQEEELLDPDDGEEDDLPVQILTRPFETPPVPPPVIPPLAPPEAAEDEMSRYERQLPGDVDVIDKKSYNALKGFISSRADREKWKLAIFRVIDEGGKKTPKYIERIPLPEGILEEDVKNRYGGGSFCWQLALENRFAGRSDLPQSMKDIPMRGEFFIDAPPKTSTDIAVSQQAAGMAEVQATSGRVMQMAIDTMKEQMDRARGDSRANTEALVSMSNVMLQGMQAQMTMMSTMAAAQNTFLMGLLDRNREEAKAGSAEKDRMWERITELLVTFSGRGEDAAPKSAVQLAIEALPKLAETFKGAGMFSVPPAGQTALPAPAPAPAAAPAPALPQKPAGEEEMWATYITQVVTQCYNLYKTGVSPSAGAQVVSELGRDEDNERLMGMSEADLLNLIDQAHQQFLKTPAPPELVEWVKAVYVELHSGGEEEEEEAPPAPLPMPVVPPIPPTPSELG